MMMQVTELLPGLPPLSILTVIGLGVACVSLFLYLLSRIPDLLFITAICVLYAAVPMLPMLRHLV